MNDDRPRRDVEAFWNAARRAAGIDAVPQPEAWSFGATPEQADGLLRLVLAGTKTATASALWDFEADEEPLPERGTLSIILDGAGHPRALIETTNVRVVPFDEVGEEHARLEGEGDLSLAHWRDVHQRFFTDHASHGRGFASSLPVVCERFRVLYRA